MRMTEPYPVLGPIARIRFGDQPKSSHSDDRLHLRFRLDEIILIAEIGKAREWHRDLPAINILISLFGEVGKSWSDRHERGRGSTLSTNCGETSIRRLRRRAGFDWKS
jgi:hypothetical protein